jgi:hypothetical protein
MMRPVGLNAALVFQHFLDAFHSGLPACVLMIAQCGQYVYNRFRCTFRSEVFHQDRNIVVDALKILTLNLRNPLEDGS